MGFDGVPKLYPHTDALNPYRADHAARSENAAKPKVQKTGKDEQVTGVYKELPQYGDDADEDVLEVLRGEISNIRLSHA